VTFAGQETRDRRTGRDAFEQAGLIIETLERGKRDALGIGVGQTRSIAQRCMS